MTARSTPPTDRDRAAAARQPLFYALARKEAGIKERVGDADNPRIVEYLKATVLPEFDPVTKKHLWVDATPHCAAFVCWCMRQAKLINPGYASARNYLKYGLPLTEPRLGCITVLSSDKRGPSAGHVAFFVKFSAERVILFGANQHNEVCEALYPRARVLGFRWPPGVPLK
jgi:uncharacterized protein (TIGR02594 family)